MTAEQKMQQRAAVRAEKYQKKKEKKQAKAEKAIARQVMVCPPDAAGRSLKIRLLGYLCRIPVLFCMVLGLSTLWASAFHLGEGGAAFGPTLLIITLLALICYGRWFTTLGGIALSTGLLAWYVSGQSSLSTFIYGAIDVGINGIIQRLYNAGYYSYAKYQITLSPVEVAYQEQLMQTFVGMITFVIALLLVPFLIRRIRIVVPLIVSILLIVPIFVFNLPVSNWAVTGVIAGCSALLIMWGYQCRYDRKEREENADRQALFADMQRPVVPESVRDRAARKQAEKERRAERRARIHERQATGVVTVADEIDDYLDAPVRRKAAKIPKADAQDVALMQQQKELRRREREQLAALRRYDRITGESRRAMGSITGFCVMILVLAVLLIPTMAVNSPFDTIDAIEHRVQYYREYVTAVLRGNDPALEMYAYGEMLKNEQPHSTTAQTQTFDYVELMRIYAQYQSPVYLQGWVGVDYADGAWSSANEAQLFEWRERYDATDMPAEDAFESFFKLMAPYNTITVESEEDLIRKYYGFEEYGFVAMMVNLRRMKIMGPELYLPRVNSSSLGLLEYRTLTPVEQPWAVYYDGVAVSSIMNETFGNYSLQTYVPSQLDPDWYINVARMIAAYNASTAEILRYEDSRNKASFRPNYQNTYVDDTHGGRYSAAAQYIESMTTAERLAAQSEIKKTMQYADFVYQTYLDLADSEIISALADKIYHESYPDEAYITELDEETGLLHRVGVVEGAKPLSFVLADRRDSAYVETYTQRHQLTMAVINYLVENHEYSLEITTVPDEALDGVENFLSVTKQGYCVQFASAAALLLRECGIPVRYMEGYVCNDYTRRVNVTGDTSRFLGEVKDSDKHAWIEVWYDGIGWVIYETTPAYYTALYGEESTTAATISPSVNYDPNDRDEVDVPDQPDEPDPVPIIPGVEGPIEGEGGLDVAFLIKCILLTVAIVAVICAVVIVIVEIIRRAKLAQTKRTQLAQQIIAQDESIFDTEEHRSAAAKALIRNTLNLLTLYGSSPKTGELRDDYAQRLSFAYEDILGYPMEYDDGALGQRESVSRFRLGELLEAVAAEEFGYGMSVPDMKKLAELYLALHEKRAARIPAPRRFTLHYVRRLI